VSAQCPRRGLRRSGGRWRTPVTILVEGYEFGEQECPPLLTGFLQGWGHSCPRARRCGRCGRTKLAGFPRNKQYSTGRIAHGHCKCIAWTWTAGGLAGRGGVCGGAGCGGGGLLVLVVSAVDRADSGGQPTIALGGGEPVGGIADRVREGNFAGDARREAVHASQVCGDGPQRPSEARAGTRVRDRGRCGALRRAGGEVR